MAIGDILGKAGIDIGGAGGSFGGLLNNLLVGGAFFVLASLVIGIFVVLRYNRKQYSNHIDIFTEIGGVTSPSGQDVAKEIILPNTSIRAFLLKKRGFFLPRPSIQTGKNHYWYFIRDDGEWINVGLANLNKEMKDLGLKYDHTDMRMQNASLKKLIDQNYKGSQWLKEYAPYIAIAILILILGIGGFLFMTGAKDVVSGLASAVKTQDETVREIGRLLSSAEKIYTTSGIREVS